MAKRKNRCPKCGRFCSTARLSYKDSKPELMNYCWDCDLLFGKIKVSAENARYIITGIK